MKPMTDDEVTAAVHTIAERMARRAREAQPKNDEPPSPVKHWSDTERDDDPPARLALEAGDVAARQTACARLRSLLADGRWHSAIELVGVGGLRYGGRLHEIRRGLDGAPALDVEAQPREHRGRTVWHYRATREGER